MFSRKTSPQQIFATAFHPTADVRVQNIRYIRMFDIVDARTALFTISGCYDTKFTLEWHVMSLKLGYVCNTR